MDQENKVVQGAEIEQEVKQVPAEGETYAVVVHPIPAPLKKQFALALDDFVLLQKEIEEKMQLAFERNGSIQARIHRLVNDAKIEINQAHYQHFNESISVYMQLLRDIRTECAEEIEWCTQIIALDAPKTIQVPLAFDADFYRWSLGHDALTDEEKVRVVNQKIEQMRRHSKVVRKDVRVSFSRYLFGFSAQLKQVEVIEHSLLRTYFAHQAHEAKKKQQMVDHVSSEEPAAQ
jgi:hypothetical protein